MQYKTPKNKTDNLVVQELGNEVLLYDLNIHKAYSLNQTTAIVYQYCDGETTFEELRRKSKTKLPDEIILLAIDELARHNLVAEKPQLSITRRNLLRKTALTAFALPAIVSLVAPLAVHAQSSTTCTDNGDTGSISEVTNTNQVACEITGYTDPQCCSRRATGTFIAGDDVCEDVTCSGI
jgi:hypothetical protein